MIEQLLQAERELTVDRVEQAEAIYRSVAESDPHNAMAVTGLARCALARGDERGAHALAARALAIDPEDDVAFRLEARLAEVLETRGEPVTRPPTTRGSGPGTSGPAVRPDRAGGSTSTAKPAPPAPAATEPRGLMARLLRR